MDKTAILRAYLSLVSTKDIANKFGMPLNDVRFFLRNHLGKSAYLEIAHKIGAKKVSDKFLSDPNYRKRYSEKMKKSVKHSLFLKMQDPTFKRGWIIKATTASKKGNETIKNLLFSNEQFRRRWSLRCSIGGKKSKRQGTGIHDSRNKLKRRNWSIKGLLRTGRKFSGPNNERMYNALETAVAEILFNAGIKYEYEKTIPANNTNGFYSLDFVIPTNTVIEVTCWDDVKQKAKKLVKKFEYMKNNNIYENFLLITRKGMVDKYKRLLPYYILVLDTPQLKTLIAGSGVKDLAY